MNFKKYILVVYILFSSLSLYSQSVEILKDSVYIDGEYYELQEVDYSNGAKYWDGVEQSHLPPENPDGMPIILMH